MGSDAFALAAIVADSDNPLTEALDETRYRGGAVGLVGRRWWRAGIESLIWEWQGGFPNFTDLLAGKSE